MREFGKYINLYLAVFLSVFFLSFPAAAQKFGADNDSRRQAVAKGQIKEYLAAMEAQGAEAEKNQRWREAANAYNQASYSARNMGQLQKAITHAAKGLDLAQKASEPQLQVDAMMFQALAFGQVGQPEKGREWLKKAAEVAKSIPNFSPIQQARVYRHLGENYLLQRETKEAIEYLSYSVQALDAHLTSVKNDRKSKRRAERIQRTENQMFNGLRVLGTTHLQAGNAQAAIKHFERAMALFEAARLRNPSDTGVVLGLGQAYLAQKNLPRATEILTKALQMAEGRRQTSVIQHASGGIGDIFLQLDKPLEALPHYKKAIDTIESTRARLESEELRTSFFEDKGQIYGGVILAHLAAKNIDEAFNYNERARSRAFLDVLGSKVQLGRQAALIEEERALQAKMSELRAKLAGDREREEEEGDGSPSGIIQELELTEKAYTDFLAKVRKENKEQASLMNVEPLTLKQTQELLEPGVTLLEYFVSRDEAMLWIVEKERVNFVRLPLKRSELVAKVGALRESVSNMQEKEKFKQASEELYRTLIEPALPHLKGKELLIVPHDVMHYLPFQALLSPQGKYLIEEYPIYYLSSASLMQFTRAKKRASREGALALGNPDLGDPAYDLRFAEREVKEVAAAFPKSAVYVRAEATKQRAVSASPDYDILHFAVHGELKEEDPLGSGLLLASEGKADGKLSAGEIFSLNLKAETVILSACETGLGKISGGDEVIGLTRAFIYAGTPSIITTLWKVNDRASYELMREFYRHLKTDKKSDALRQAQLKTMKEFPHPFFWAAYNLIGEP